MVENISNIIFLIYVHEKVLIFHMGIVTLSGIMKNKKNIKNNFGGKKIT